MLREDGNSSDSSFEEDQSKPKHLVFVTGSSGKLGTAVVKYLSKHLSAKVKILTNNIYLKYFGFDQHICRTTLASRSHAPSGPP